jgi:hypothetical protein
MRADWLDRLRGRLARVLPSAFQEGAMPWVFFVGLLVGIFMLCLAAVEYRTFGDRD